jgi:hypothetical protein
MRLLSVLTLFLLLHPSNGSTLLAQVQTFPYAERFDSVTTPALPPGWSTSTNRSTSGDFGTTVSSPHSSPNAAISTNSMVSQYLVTPRFDFSNHVPDKLEFWTSRSSTHTSGVLVEASTDNGLTFPITISDTLKNPGSTPYNLISLNLPPSLGNQSQVRLRWRVIGGTGGTSGTFRIDDVSLSVERAIDLAIQSVRVAPAFPLTTDSLTFSILIANVGTLSASTYTLELFDDVNHDSVGQASEQLEVLSPPPINAGDSLSVEVKSGSLASGDHQILCLLSISGDENATNNNGIVNFFVGVPPLSVVINEIMYAPTGGEPEWIEIFNTSSTTINLRNWKLANRISSTRYAIATTDVILAPKIFAVITRDSLALHAFHPSIPGLLFTNNSLPIALFRNDSDAVVLYDPRNSVIDSLYYRPGWGGGGGKSLERISPEGASAARSNWGTSVDPSGSTPGRVNTLTQKENDLAITDLSVSPSFPTVNSTLNLTVKVANVGMQPASGYSVSFFEDANWDSTGQADEVFSRVTATPTLQAGDSATFSAQPPNVLLGDHRYLVTIEYPLDEENFNNTRVIVVTVGLPPKSVVINEIMYAPTGGEPEWIEIFSASTTTINLRNWKLSNRISSAKYAITETDASLSPRSLAVITRDSLAFQAFHSSIPSPLFINNSLPIALFRNDSDAVTLYDQRNSVIDSLYYRSSWGGGGGKSLERISPQATSTERSSWGTSVDPSGSTPGRVNTLTPKENDLAIIGLIASPPFPTANSTVTLVARVKNVGMKPASGYLVSFFEDMNGDSVGELGELITRVTSMPTLQVGDSATFSTQTPNVMVGEHHYLVAIEYSQDEENLNNTRSILVTVGLLPKTVVVNEIMYGPTGGEPEWIEIYNTFSVEVNLKNWKFSNRFTSSKYVITASDVLLPQKAYAVITRDSLAFFTFHPSTQGLLFVNTNLPIALFSNSGDAVVLYDARSVMMDSLTYAPSWGGLNGRSLERIDFDGNSTDSTNWGTSNGSEGSTPARLNSIATLANDLRVARIQSPDLTTLPLGKVTSRPLLATIENIGREPASGYSVKFYHDADRDSILTPTELIGVVTPSVSLQRRDTTLVPFMWEEAPSGLVKVTAVLDYVKDERPSNNSASVELRIRSLPRALIINEIMYAPFSGQAEWVELYNPNSFPVDVSEWTLSDMRDAAGKANVFSIAKNLIQIEPGGYAVISSDSTIFSQFPSLQTSQRNSQVIILNRTSLSLNNEGDDVILSDLVGTVIDSVRYSPSWHNPDITDATGISLERINPNLSSIDRRNWSSCVEKVGGTPGRENSIFTTSIPTQTMLSVSPNPFSPDGDGFEDFTVISYKVSSQIARIRLKIFDSLGRPVRTLANYEPSASTGQIIWDGLDDDKRRLRIGIYIVLLEAVDSSGSTVESAKAAAVVAGKL